MTSIPKPLKFMRAHFDTLKTAFEAYPENENKALPSHGFCGYVLIRCLVCICSLQKLLADVLSVLAMTMPGSKGLSLKFKLSGTKEALDLWGHEYVRYVAPLLSSQELIDSAAI
jgi:26S proteasome regulatory subunit N1